MKLELDAEQRDALTAALEGVLSELHDEIAHTDSFDYRQQLKAKRGVLQGILDSLQSTA